MLLLVGFYSDPDPGRLREFLECLRRNAENPHIHGIHVMAEDAAAAQQLAEWLSVGNQNKITLIEHGRRLTFQAAFGYANEWLSGRRVIIANADIFFDETLGLLESHDLTNVLLCLSRWDVGHDGSTCFFDHPGSQDAWIFDAPIRPFDCDFHLGLLGCDNRLAWEAAHAGLLLSNPSWSIRANHLHLTGVRRYTEPQRLQGPGAPVVASALFLETGRPDCASVAFRENMGYTIARLEQGVSSHNNETRPLSSIPTPLLGLPFTQVVARHVSPVEIDFRSRGVLYVLVGTDWEGHQPLTTFLGEVASRTSLPPLQTMIGTTFDVWSLEREAGDQLVFPTQVMLVSRELVHA
jgi:hypothetical protein